MYVGAAGRDSWGWSSPLLTFYCPARPCIPLDHGLVCSAPRGADATRASGRCSPAMISLPIINRGLEVNTMEIRSEMRMLGLLACVFGASTLVAGPASKVCQLTGADDR